MSGKKIVVPEGMLKAVCENWSTKQMTIEMRCRSVLEAALLWLSENPIVPTLDQWRQCLSSYDDAGKTGYECAILFEKEWQGRMFDAPEPEVPDAIVALMCRDDESIPCKRIHNERILESALRWLDEELEAMLNSKPPEHSVKFREAIFDVLRMFVAPEPEVLEEIKDLLVQHEDQTLRCTIYDANQRLIEAFRRGQKSRETA